MEIKNVIYIGGMLGNLTMTIAEATIALERIQKLFADDKIVIEEKHAEDLVTALTKLLALINKCEREDIDR